MPTLRGEALVGLARRQDEHVLGALLKELAPEQMARLEERPDLPLEAAAEIADPRLLPASSLRKQGWETDTLLEDAIARCRSRGRHAQERE